MIDDQPPDTRRAPDDSLPPTVAWAIGVWLAGGPWLQVQRLPLSEAAQVVLAGREG